MKCHVVLHVPSSKTVLTQFNELYLNIDWVLRIYMVSMNDVTAYVGRYMEADRSCGRDYLQCGPEVQLVGTRYAIMRHLALIRYILALFYIV